MQPAPIEDAGSKRTAEFFARMFEVLGEYVENADYFSLAKVGGPCVLILLRLLTLVTRSPFSTSTTHFIVHRHAA